LAKNCKITLEKIRKYGGKRQDRLMQRNSEGKGTQEEKEVDEHCRLYFKRFWNEGFIENHATKSTREGWSEEDNDTISPSKGTEILRERWGRLETFV
jgi:hypothetical protein